MSNSENVSGTGCAATDAHQALVARLTGTLLEVARWRQDDLPGLVETLQDDVMVTTGGTTRRAYGWFAEGAWRYGERRVHELFLNADRRGGPPSVGDAENVLTTLLHEACHAWAQAHDIRDTSRDGRYHNRRFAEIALSIGLQVERDAAIGHQTPSLTTRGRAEYADLLTELDDTLVLAREPRLVERVPDGDEDDRLTDPADSTDPQTRSKYIFASCRCQDNRGHKVTLRVAKGSWRPGVIRCAACDEAFAES